MFMKIHVHESDSILAACDEDLIGKTFRGDGMKLDVNQAFYGGSKVDRAVLAENMASVSIMNLVGDETVSVAIEEGYASADSIIEIGGVKHVQVVLM